MYIEDQPNDTPSQPKTMTIDEAYDSIGRFGKYQIWVCISSLITMMYIFSVPLFLIFPPVNGCPAGSSSVCQNSDDACAVNVTRSYPDPHFNYISEFDLTCNDIAATSIALAFVIGSLVGSFLFSTISDNFGRLRVLAIGQLGNIACLLTIVIAGNYEVTLVLSGLGGFLVAASGTPTYAFAYDSSHVETIKFHGTYINLTFAIGEIIIALLMWTGISWRTMCIFICFWSVLFFIIRAKLVEPPKFLLSKNRTEDATQNLKYIAKVNGKPLPDDFALATSATESGKQATSCWDIVKLLSEKTTLSRLVMCMLLYFSSGYIYYGISMNIQRYKGNIYANAALNGLVEVIAVFFSGITMGSWGVKFPFALSFGIAGAFMLMLQLASDHPMATSVFVALGKFGISSCFNFVYVIVGEIFPTSIKNTALGLCLIADRIGSVLGPVVGLNPTVFQIGSSLLCIACVVIVIKLPLSNDPPKPREISFSVKA